MGKKKVDEEFAVIAFFVIAIILLSLVVVFGLAFVFSLERKGDLSMAFYNSPRWSGEILDCSMPLTFDQFNRCSYDCLYCFSFFQRSLSTCDDRVKDKRIYTEKPPLSVNPERIKSMFDLAMPKCEFNDYIREGITIQWGGLSDPFDNFERKEGVGLEIMRHLHRKRYPICFSTKGTWWLEDERYRRLFHKNDFWNVKFSIINMDAKKAKLMERGCPSPEERLNAIEELTILQGKPNGPTLRLRPFIIGYSDANEEHVELIEAAGAAGARAVSTEFLCIESRTTPESRERFEAMSNIIGIDLIKFYKQNTVNPTGYLRLNWKIKEPRVRAMEAACGRVGMRFYVSDAHWKNRCANGSCCGLGEGWNYHRGQFTEALVIAKRNGTVRWRDLEENLLPCFDRIKIVPAAGLNIARGTARDRARFRDWSIADYIRYIWNSPDHPRSPYKYFYGLLSPAGKDRGGNVIYKYQPYGGDND